MTTDVLRTALYDAHVACGGRMVTFAGYDMPVQYTSIIAETQAVRQKAGMFDVSHMARLKFTGDRVTEYLEWVTSNDVSKLLDGEGQYSLLPNFEGGCVDDIIVYRISATEYRMVVNAANHAKDVAWLRAQNNFGVEIEDYTDSTAMIAVQGPEAAAIVCNLAADASAFQDAPFFGVVNGHVAGVEVFAGRSGYTGEDGFELICAAAGAPKLWDVLRNSGVLPCGLGSRDILRVEAGLPLYGHELNDTLSPIAAGLGWVVGKTKTFIGSEHINKVRAEGSPVKLQGIKMATKRFPAIGSKVFVAGEEVGEVCSGVYSPTLEIGLAFAFLRADVKLNTACEVDLRGKLEPGTVASKRFWVRPKD